MNLFKDKVIVILGAAGKDNMGQVIARRFAAEGAKVVVAGRHQRPLAELAAEIGGDSQVCDITRKAEVEALSDSVWQRYGRAHVAINCTGWGLLAKLLDTTEKQLDQLSALHFKGTFFFMQAFVGRMSRSGGGSVITVSSASVRAVLYHHAAYIATKAASEALVRCFANEFGAKGVKVNALAPGFTETPMTATESKLPGLLDLFRKEYPLGRIGTTQDVAEAALWFASEASFITGETLQINGGLTLRRNPSPAEINAALKANVPPRS
ncbi:MAG: SDR family oxidoreductase [Gammaproteobacteria bacterium]|nr:SDR family oxidoreductase [Gammaproteobacteria bacterium]